MKLAVFGLCLLSIGYSHAQMFSISGLAFPGPRGAKQEAAPEKRPNQQPQANRRAAEIGGRPVGSGLRPPQGFRPNGQPQAAQQRANPQQPQPQAQPEQLKPFSPEFTRSEFKRPAVFGPDSGESGEDDFAPARRTTVRSVPDTTTTIRPTTPPTTSKAAAREAEARREAEVRREAEAKRDQEKAAETRQQFQEKIASQNRAPVKREQESFEEDEEEIEPPKPKRPALARRQVPANQQRRAFKRPSAADDGEEAADIQTPVIVKRPQESKIKVAPKKFKQEIYEAEQKRRLIAQQEIESLEEEEEEEEKPDRLTLLLQESTFSCSDKKDGYYADEGLNCEIFHYCQGKVRHSWLCPAGAAFHQVHLLCMPASNDNVCKRSSDYHFVNDYLYKSTNEDNTTYADRYYPEDYEPGHPMNLEKVTPGKPQTYRQAPTQAPQRKVQPKKQFNAQDAFFNNDDYEFRGDQDRPRPDERQQRPEGQQGQRGPNPNQRPDVRQQRPENQNQVPTYRPQPGQRRMDKAPEKRPAQPSEEEFEDEEEE